MRISTDHILYKTHALTRPATARAAAEALRGASGKAAVEGLVELIYQSETALPILAAIAALEECGQPIVVDALLHALHSSHNLVRLAAVQALQRRQTPRAIPALLRVLRTDLAWTVRRAAVKALADASQPARRHIMAAATDPHWRVRHALIQVLLRWGETAEQQQEIGQRLAKLGNDVRARGVRIYLRYRWSGQVPLPEDIPQAEDISAFCPFWDWDPPVMARTLEQMGQAGRKQHLEIMPLLLDHDDGRVRKWAVDTLRRWGTVSHLARALAFLEEPRSEAVESVTQLLGFLNLDRVEELARFILAMPAPSPAQLAWAIDQVRVALPVLQQDAALNLLEPLVHDADGRVRRCLAEALAKRPEPAVIELLQKLQADNHPLVRAAALTETTAAELVADPTWETSWHVLAQAALMKQVPLWELEPETPWQPETPSAPLAEAISLPVIAPARARMLGPQKLLVSPIGISGAYGLPVEGFAQAVEAGVNLFFWEPGYHTLTDFFARLSHADRQALHVIAGTFEADAKNLRRDVDRTLRQLQIERFSLFMVFWVRSWNRLPEEVCAMLDALQQQGKIAGRGLSTHSRPLAIRAMQTGWNPVMVRHSAAHRGAEETVLPAARELGTSIITFNNTCYGRLLQAQGNLPAPSAGDCYRYTLAQPGVTVCLSAPATLAELEENLTALHDPELPLERLQRLLAQGDAVYQEDTIFRKLVRAL